MKLKYFLTKGTVTFINGPANLFNNDPKNLPAWIIFKIWALESYKSVDILLLNAFLNSVLCLVVNNNSWGRSFPSNIFKLILRVAPVLFLTAVFNLFSFVSDNFTFALLYSTIYTNYRTFAVPLWNSNTVSLDCSKIVNILIFVISTPPATSWNIIYWIAFGSASKAFCLLRSTAIDL